jgi:hypothetical protein
MSLSNIPQAPDEDEPWPYTDVTIPPECSPGLVLTLCEFDPPDALDPRLQGYHLRLLLSNPTPEDPTPRSA